MRWVVYREGQGTDPDSLERAGIDGAKRIILLSPTDAGLDADAVTLTRLTAVRDMNPDAHVFAELLSDESVGLALKVGGSGTFPLNVPRFLGLFLCQHLLVPGGDAVLRELLAAQGSEFYTHIFADPIEHTRLHENADHTVDFATLAAWSYANFGVLLAGVFVGESPQERTHHDLIPVDRLQAWLNPAAPVVTGNEVRFVAKDGQIPYRNLAGIIGVAPSYEPVRACGRALLRVAPEEFAAAPSEKRGASASRLPTLTAPTLSVKHVLVIGYSPAITSLIDGIDRFIPGVHITVALSARADSHTELRDRLQEIAVLGLDNLDPESPPGHEGQTYDLPHGGTMLLFTSEGANLSRFVERVLPKQSIDAAVFLSDPESPDKDARTTLRVLRFAETLRRQSTTSDPNIPVNDQLHILVELASLRRGVRLREQLMANAPHMQANKLTVTLASTDQIRGYFLVHSAFVPGITTVYESLLEDDGVELVRLLLQPDSSHETLTMLQLIEGLAHRGVIPLAIEKTDGAIIVTPAADREFDPQSVRAIFALAERSCLNRL